MTDALALGDVVTCQACGTTAIAYSTSGRHVPGVALLLSWHGYRHEAALQRPALCSACTYADPVREAPTRRVQICDELARNGCRLSGFEWCTDADVEDAFQRWLAAGSPPLAVVEARTTRGETVVERVTPAEAARDLIPERPSAPIPYGLPPSVTRFGRVGPLIATRDERGGVIVEPVPRGPRTAKSKTCTECSGDPDLDDGSGMKCAACRGAGKKPKKKPSAQGALF